MGNYIHKRKETYHYRRRVPKELQSYFPSLYYTKALSRDMTTAKAIASTISMSIDTAVTMLRLSKKPDLSTLVHVSQEPLPTLTDLSSNYFKTLSVTKGKMSSYKTMIKTIIAISDEISHKSLDGIRDKLQRLPKRNIQRYRMMSLTELISDKTLKTVAIKDKLTSKSINEYLKILNSILSFGYDRGVLSQHHKIKLLPINHQARTERSALTHSEVEAFIKVSRSPELALSYQLLYLTGMRLSEAYKCTISAVNGVLCFDLRHATEALKNSNSYRLIPVHSAIQNPEQSLKAITSLKPSYLSRKASEMLGGGKKTLYSLRHSFATILASKGVQVGVVSELMGHSHKSITLNRYTKGYPVDTLLTEINKLDAV